jgi:hypothetical protein
MLEGGVVTSGGSIIAGSAIHSERFTSLAVFERCVEEAAAMLLCIAV